MISGNKGFKKQVVSKGHRTKHSAITFRNDRNKRPKKKGNPLAGVKILPETKIEVLLHTEEPKLKQQEIEMADMQTELSKVIDSWDDEPATDNTIPEVPQRENKSRATTTQIVFDRIRDNPGYARGYYVSTLGVEGLNSGTVGSVITKLSMQGLIAMANDRGLSVTRKTYAPMYGKPPRAARRSAAHGIPTSVPEARAPLIPPAAEEWTVESVVDKLNIRQARAVYIELRTLLGVER